MKKMDTLDKFTILVIITFFLLFLAFTCFASTPYKDLSQGQSSILRSSYVLCWQESDCGKYNIGINEIKVLKRGDNKEGE